MRLLLIALVAFFICTPTSAQEVDAMSGASPWTGGHAEMSAEDKAKLEAQLAEWRDELALSPEQQAIMAEIVADYGSRLKPQFEVGAETAWSIMQVAPKDPDYSLDTERAAQAAAETAAEVVRVMSEMRSAIYSIMTTDQIATLERLMEERRQAIEAAKQAKQAEQEAAASAE